MGILAPAADERVDTIIFNDALLSVALKDGRIISVPLTWYPRLEHATKKERENWQVSSDGYEIHWPDIDEDLSTEGLLLGIPAAKNIGRISRRSVDSDAIASIGYNKEAKMLELEFRDSGEVFRYLGVPEDEYQKFMAAESMGSYLNRDFKKAGYRYLRVK